MQWTLCPANLKAPLDDASTRCCNSSLLPSEPLDDKEYKTSHTAHGRTRNYPLVHSDIGLTNGTPFAKPNDLTLGSPDGKWRLGHVGYSRHIRRHRWPKTLIVLNFQDGWNEEGRVLQGVGPAWHSKETRHSKVASSLQMVLPQLKSLRAEEWHKPTPNEDPGLFWLLCRGDQLLGLPQI